MRTHTRKQKVPLSHGSGAHLCSELVPQGPIRPAVVSGFFCLSSPPYPCTSSRLWVSLHLGTGPACHGGWHGIIRLSSIRSGLLHTGHHATCLRYIGFYLLYSKSHFTYWKHDPHFPHRKLKLTRFIQLTRSYMSRKSQQRFQLSPYDPKLMPFLLTMLPGKEPTTRALQLPSEFSSLRSVCGWVHLAKLYFKANSNFRVTCTVIKNIYFFIEKSPL